MLGGAYFFALMGSSVLHRPQYRRLCQHLRGPRVAAGLTQRDLAARLKRPHTFVHKCESGERRIDPLEFIIWCIACDRDPSESLKELRRELIRKTAL